MKYKLIALDVDGTLLTDDHELTAPTIETIRQVNQAGAQIVLCTGRGPGNAIPVMEELGLQGAVITHNGAATIRTEDRSLVHQVPFEAAELEAFIRYCREHRVHYDYSTAFHLHIDTDLSEHLEEMYRKFQMTPFRVADVSRMEELAVKFTVYSPDKERVDQVEADWSQAGSRLRVLRSGDFFIDVMHAEASKGHALRALCGSLGIPREQVLAMGNYYNDIEMLQFAGWGIAMDNSPEEVKQAADEVTVSNNEGGVYRSLRRLCL
ncbi:Cof-type HAD-IIB family hydrolase [Paenibacillus sp. HJGM_3]|uniref:Cof-type HAD-IIB family hydrolase n=1 Tax=Paenibacillus sp. HJGM_3 TaxID=3379816 RepID=UPI00385FB017